MPTRLAPLLIDSAMAREQFAALPAATAATLALAAYQDIAQWCAALLAATRADDAPASARARHALKGLCGNFGAAALVALADGPLARDAQRAAFLACQEATLAAILQIYGLMAD